MQADKPIPESYWVIPGQILAGEYPTSEDDPARARQRIAAFLRKGFDTFIDLTSPDDASPYEALLKQEAAEFGLQVHYHRFPIGDYGLPSREQMQATLDQLDQACQQGRKTYLHCQGGIGRTGTVVGCYLVRQGLDGQQALNQLAEWWRKVPKSALHPRSPETAQQEDFVRNWPEGGRIIRP
ncbi:MAG: dual specificity protein phosphatase family protein [Anaerolineae bacterium]|nr:dual specificity protein phosphatase family protein [Anaerolineae bacterium]